MVFRRSSLLLSLILLVLLLTLSQNSTAQERRKPVTVEGKKFLPLRVLVRPFSNVYKEKNENGGTVIENVPTFHSFYVYSRPSQDEIGAENGWYEVGSDNRGTIVGWMKAKDVFEWKQTMCLAYTHPEGRKPVLMFENKKDLVDLVRLGHGSRIKKAEGYYQTIDSNTIPTDFPVESIEPKKAIDIAEEFYLLPILEFAPIEIENREGRLLKLTAATAAGPEAREKADIRTNRAYLNEATEKSIEVAPNIIKKLSVDLVWVVDTTVSMRPHLKKSLEVVKSVSKELAKDPEVAKSIRFGFWGYRDSVEHIPNIGYTTKNYTPLLETIDNFVPTLEKIRVTKADSVDWPEDVFSGIDKAIDYTNWSKDSIRLVILIGDAPSHKMGHPWNISGQNEKTLRLIADDKAVYVYALFIKDPRAKKYYETARSQFKTLSMNRGMGGEASYWEVDTKDLNAFGRVTSTLTEAVKNVTALSKRGKAYSNGNDLPANENKQNVHKKEKMTSSATVSASGSSETLNADDKAWLSESSETKPSPSNATEEPAYKRLAYRMIRAALVEWIGSQTRAKAPRDIVAWAIDKDLIDPSIQSMEVRLLISKRQLSSLASVLKEIIAAGRKGQVSGGDFFEMLQATAATASREPEQIRNAKSMLQTGLIPEFLVGLPYKSQIMDMNNELWYSLSVDEQDEFLNALDAKIKAYQTIVDSPEEWIALNKGDDPGGYVYPISLDLLP